MSISVNEYVFARDHGSIWLETEMLKHGMCFRFARHSCRTVPGLVEQLGAIKIADMGCGDVHMIACSGMSAA